MGDLAMRVHGELRGDGRFLHRVIRTHEPRNRWKGFVLGAAGSLAGLLLMRLYQQRIGPTLAGLDSRGERERSGTDRDDGGRPREGGGREPAPLDSISLVGTHHEEDELSTAALGRIVYRGLTGRDPSEETKATLSYEVHWLYGIMMGGVYGAMRGGVGFPDLAGDLMYATGLWFFGDELAVPLLGLQGGPTATPAMDHVNRLGAHLSYGAGLAVGTQLLHSLSGRLMGRESIEPPS